MDRYPKKNLTTKILAVFFATVLWLYVMNEQNPPIEVSQQVPLEVRNLVAGAVATDTPDSVKVKMRGPRSIVAGLTLQDLKSYIDLKGLSEGQHNVKVNTAIPANLEMLEVVPEKVAVRISTMTSIEKTVEVVFSGKASPGFAVGKTTTSINQVKVDGLSKDLEKLNKVVAVIDITDRKADFTADVPLLPLSTDGKVIEGLKLTPNRIAVNVSINTVKKEVDIRPTTVGQLPDGFTLKQVTSDPAKIEVYGNGKVIEKVDYVNTEPVDISEITKDTTKEVKLKLQEGVLTNRSTIIMKITLEKAP